MQGGGSGRVESMVQFGAFVRLVREFCSQGGEFVVLAGLTWRESLARGDADVPFGQYPYGSVHGGATEAGFFPEVVLDQPSVGALRAPGQ